MPVTIDVGDYRFVVNQDKFSLSPHNIFRNFEQFFSQPVDKLYIYHVKNDQYHPYNFISKGNSLDDLEFNDYGHYRISDKEMHFATPTREIRNGVPFFCETPIPHFLVKDVRFTEDCILRIVVQNGTEIIKTVPGVLINWNIVHKPVLMKFAGYDIFVDEYNPIDILGNSHCAALSKRISDELKCPVSSMGYPLADGTPNPSVLFTDGGPTTKTIKKGEAFPFAVLPFGGSVILAIALKDNKLCARTEKIEYDVFSYLAKLKPTKTTIRFGDYQFVINDNKSVKEIKTDDFIGFCNEIHSLANNYKVYVDDAEFKNDTIEFSKCNTIQIKTPNGKIPNRIIAPGVKFGNRKTTDVFLDDTGFVVKTENCINYWINKYKADRTIFYSIKPKPITILVGKFKIVADDCGNFIDPIFIQSHFAELNGNKVAKVYKDKEEVIAPFAYDGEIIRIGNVMPIEADVEVEIAKGKVINLDGESYTIQSVRLNDEEFRISTTDKFSKSYISVNSWKRFYQKISDDVGQRYLSPCKPCKAAIEIEEIGSDLTVNKAGTNPPNNSSLRPAKPGGSGSCKPKIMVEDIGSDLTEGVKSHPLSEDNMEKQDYSYLKSGMPVRIIGKYLPDKGYFRQFDNCICIGRDGKIHSLSNGQVQVAFHGEMYAPLFKPEDIIPVYDPDYLVKEFPIGTEVILKNVNNLFHVLENAKPNVGVKGRIVNHEVCHLRASAGQVHALTVKVNEGYGYVRCFPYNLQKSPKKEFHTQDQLRELYPIGTKFVFKKSDTEIVECSGKEAIVIGYCPLSEANVIDKDYIGYSSLLVTVNGKEVWCMPSYIDKVLSIPEPQAMATPQYVTSMDFVPDKQREIDVEIEKERAKIPVGSTVVLSGNIAVLDAIVKGHVGAKRGGQHAKVTGYFRLSSGNVHGNERYIGQIAVYVQNGAKPPFWCLPRHLTRLKPCIRVGNYEFFLDDEATVSHDWLNHVFGKFSHNRTPDKIFVIHKHGKPMIQPIDYSPTQQINLFAGPIIELNAETPIIRIADGCQISWQQDGKEYFLDIKSVSVTIVDILIKGRLNTRENGNVKQLVTNFFTMTGSVLAEKLFQKSEVPSKEKIDHVKSFEGHFNSAEKLDKDKIVKNWNTPENKPILSDKTKNWLYVGSMWTAVALVAAEIYNNAFFETNNNNPALTVSLIVAILMSHLLRK